MKLSFQIHSVRFRQRIHVNLCLVLSLPYLGLNIAASFNIVDFMFVFVNAYYHLLRLPHLGSDTELHAALHVGSQVGVQLRLDLMPALLLRLGRLGLMPGLHLRPELDLGRPAVSSSLCFSFVSQRQVQAVAFPLEAYSGMFHRELTSTVRTTSGVRKNIRSGIASLGSAY